MGISRCAKAAAVSVVPDGIRASTTVNSFIMVDPFRS